MTLWLWVPIAFVLGAAIPLPAALLDRGDRTERHGALACCLACGLMAGTLETGVCISEALLSATFGVGLTILTLAGSAIIGSRIVRALYARAGRP